MAAVLLYHSLLYPADSSDSSKIMSFWGYNKTCLSWWLPIPKYKLLKDDNTPSMRPFDIELVWMASEINLKSHSQSNLKNDGPF